MTDDPVTLSDLLETRDRLRVEIEQKLTPAHKEFLLSFVSCEPRWDLINCSHLSELPAIRWKLKNLEHFREINPARFREQHERLKTGFEKG
jgi:hypothetical protein